MSKSNFDNNQNYFNFIDNKTIPLVFVHGVGLDHKMWNSQIKSFLNFSTLTYDLLGHGKTNFEKENVTLNDFSNQLLSILDFLKIEKINLVGFSLGSLIALDFASKFDKKINSLTLIGTTYKRTDEQRKMVIDRYNQAKLNKPISKQALKRWFSDKYLNEHPETYDEFMQILNKNPNDHKNFLKSYNLFANHVDDIEKIKKINCRTLVMTGSNDPGSTPLMSRELSNDLANARFIEIPDGKHLCSIECADIVNKNINKFIEN